MRKRLVGVIVGITVVICLAGATAAVVLRHNNSSPVPKDISKILSFPVYYSDQSRLPAGYTLDASSFKKPVSNGVTFIVTYNNGKSRLVFSEQPTVTDSEMDSFVANYIPLNNQIQTPLGTARLGAYNTKGATKTLVSLPTQNHTWIIVTGPYDTDQAKLSQVLGSLRSNN